MKIYRLHSDITKYFSPIIQIEVETGLDELVMDHFYEMTNHFGDREVIYQKLTNSYICEGEVWEKYRDAPETKEMLETMEFEKHFPKEDFQKFYEAPTII